MAMEEEEQEEGVSVEDVEDPEIEALPSVEEEKLLRGGGVELEEEEAAGVQDHYQVRSLAS
jgi:hypothetical protein